MLKKIILFLSLVFSLLSFGEEAIPDGQLDSEKFKVIATKIFMAQKLIPDEYEYAGNITLGLYFLRYLGEVGKFQFHADDIEQLIVAVESLYGEPLNATLKSILFSIKRLYFYQKNNRFYTQIFT